MHTYMYVYMCMYMCVSIHAYENDVSMPVDIRMHTHCLLSTTHVCTFTLCLHMLYIHLVSTHVCTYTFDCDTCIKMNYMPQHLVPFI